MSTKLIAMIANESYAVRNKRREDMTMASNLVVRNIDPDLVQALRQMAAANGRSAEAEHREILRQALGRPVRQSFAEFLLSMPDVGSDADFNQRNGAA